MAPSFFSKLVKSPGSAHSREKSDRSLDARRSPSPGARSRSVSAASPPSMNSSTFSAVSTPSNIRTEPTIVVPDDGHDANPSVTIVPPSPHSTTGNSHTARRIDGLPPTNGNDMFHGDTEEPHHSRSLSTATQPRSRTTSTTAPPPLPTTLDASPSRSSSRPGTASSSKSNIREAFIPAFGGKDPSGSPTHEMRNKSSTKSLRTQPPEAISTSVAHNRAATTPAEHQAHGTISQTVLVESPASSPTSAAPPDFSAPSQSPKVNGGGAQLTASPTRNGDALKEDKDGKKRAQTGKWKRPAAKSTGLASAIAASGLAMANPALSAQQQAHHQAQISPPATGPPNKKATLASPPYLNPRGSGSAVSANTSTHTRMGSSDFSPKSKGSKKRGTSVSSDHSDYFPEGQVITSVDYYSGLEDDSSEDGGDTDDSDNLLDLDLVAGELPVTGFAVASSRRNADFHELFSTIPDGDYLIEDYGCALQREILIQGRLYISENHICFHANIFGWITDLSIPVYEITSLEKKMTAFVIPNAIQITTRQNKYSFTSFLSRDTTFDVIYNIWRLARPEDSNSVGSASRGQSMDQIVEGTMLGTGSTPGQVIVAGAPAGAIKKKVTECQCGKDGKHFSEKALEMIVPGSPEKIYTLMFASEFMKQFLVVDQKLMDIQVSDWAPITDGSKLLGRNMSYIKPLNGSVGPRQTKCEIRDETEHCDFEDYISTVTTTKNPDVPSGGVFSVKTRACMMWASQMSTKIVVTTQVEWTGRSFIKGIIERSAIDGQRVYHTALEKAMRAYIKEHQTEFVPEGVDPAALAPEEVVTADAPADTVAKPDQKQLEHERDQRAFQWAWDTFEGAASVARSSSKGLFELLSETWDQSSSRMLTILVIVGLVMSNLYMLMSMSTREEAGRRKALQGNGDKDKWISGVVSALREELRVAAVPPIPLPTSIAPPQVGLGLGGDVTEVDEKRIGDEIRGMAEMLDAMEVRIRTMKDVVRGLAEEVHAETQTQATELD